MSAQVRGTLGADSAAVGGGSLTAAAYSRAVTRADEKLARYQRETAQAEARYIEALRRW